MILENSTKKPLKSYRKTKRFGGLAYTLDTFSPCGKETECRLEKHIVTWVFGDSFGTSFVIGMRYPLNEYERLSNLIDNGKILNEL